MGLEPPAEIQVFRREVARLERNLESCRPSACEPVEAGRENAPRNPPLLVVVFGRYGLSTLYRLVRTRAFLLRGGVVHKEDLGLLRHAANLQEELSAVREKVDALLRLT